VVKINDPFAWCFDYIFFNDGGFGRGNARKEVFQSDGKISLTKSAEYSPAIVKRIQRELQDIQKVMPEGILLIQNDDDILDIQAWIQGPGSFFN
jgi:hypothetical protein